jgi:hypothetical protein
MAAADGTMAMSMQVTRFENVNYCVYKSVLIILNVVPDRVTRVQLMHAWMQTDYAATMKAPLDAKAVVDEKN